MNYMYDKNNPDQLNTSLLYSSFKLENSILVLGMGFKETRKRILSKYRTRTLLKVQFTYIQIYSNINILDTNSYFEFPV